MNRPFHPRAYTMADRAAFDRRYGWPVLQPMPKWLVNLYRAAFCLAGAALIAAALA